MPKIYTQITDYKLSLRWYDSESVKFEEAHFFSINRRRFAIWRRIYKYWKIFLSFQDRELFMTGLNNENISTYKTNEKNIPLWFQYFSVAIAC